MSTFATSGAPLRDKRNLTAPLKGGGGSANAAALTAAGIGRLTLLDTETGRAQALAARLDTHASRLKVAIGPSDSAAFDIVVNSTPLGMNDDDPLPFDPDYLGAASLVGDVVLAEKVDARL